MLTETVYKFHVHVNVDSISFSPKLYEKKFLLYLVGMHIIGNYSRYMHYVNTM